ncbi:MAG: hypothetical protein HY661_07475 [Betaproteobacteria bacterium]|nr:hypothetical protein [Betaproteobacteria bacterium]
MPTCDNCGKPIQDPDEMLCPACKPPLLTPYTRQDLEAAEPAEELAPAVTPARRVKIDQADLFADQGALFGHVKQPGELE